MYRIDDKTALPFMPIDEAVGTEGYFTEGNRGSGTPATIVRASWLNMVQEELRNIVIAGGLTPEKGSNTQVLEALLAKFARRVAPAQGVANQIRATFDPVVSKLTDGLSVLVRAAMPNTEETPTFQADATAAREIVKGNDLPLQAGDIAGEGHWMELQYDARLDKWVLQNPAWGIFMEPPQPIADAEGTEDALTAHFPSALKALTHGLTVRVRALYANKSVSPTFQADSTLAKTIVKGNGLPLLAGDIAGEGHWLELQYDARMDKWTLQNPANGVFFVQQVPPGSIIYLARSTAPAGYLKANGAAISRTVYADLFDAIGTTFGAGDGATTFNLPDLRGEFVRGWDDDRGVDAGRGFGNVQGDAIRNIRATWSLGYTFPGGSTGVTSSGAVSFEAEGSRNPSNANTAGGRAVFNAANVVPTASENRPRNMSLLACIRY